MVKDEEGRLSAHSDCMETYDGFDGKIQHGSGVSLTHHTITWNTMAPTYNSDTLRIFLQTSFPTLKFLLTYH